MPELPEVEIARENLEQWLCGRRIRCSEIYDLRMLRGQSRRCVEEVLEGARVRAVKRRGKYLILELWGYRPSVIAHLGMSGKFLKRTNNEGNPLATRVSLSLSRGERVLMSDVRRLGRFRLMDDVEATRLAKLGIDPLEHSFTVKVLQSMAVKALLPVKMFLMDQRRLAGIGNIQAAEALFLARIHPSRITGELTVEELRHLHGAIRRTIQETLRQTRSEEINYVHEKGISSSFHVYGRKGKPCTVCGNGVSRLTQAGRSTYFCPACQRTSPMSEVRKNEARRAKP